MMPETPRPPRLAVRVVGLAVPAKSRATCLGDLDERYLLMVQRHGVARAKRWYRRQAWSFALRMPAQRVTDATRSTGRVLAGGGMGALGRDIAYSLRTLRNDPGFTIPAIAILALAIAANSTVLSIVDNVLLRDLPFRDADSVAVLWDVRPPESDAPGRMPISFNLYRQWADRDDLFEEVGAIETLMSTVEAEEYTLETHGMMVTGNMFAMLGGRAQMGRTLLPEDELPGSPVVAVISHRLWRDGFGSDPNVVGRSASISNQAATIVGVMPEDFWFFDPYAFGRSIGERENAQPDVFRPLLRMRDWEAFDPDYPAMRVFARLRPGTTIDAARAALLAARNLNLDPTAPRASVEVVALEDEVLGAMAGRLLMLQGAVGLLMLVACVNVMSLVLARSSARRGELAIRAALGAGRAALVRLTIIETTLLGIGGGVLGVLLAHNLSGVVLRMAPRELPLAQRVGVDWRVAALTLGIALASGLIAGLLPALGLDFGSLTRSLRAGSRNVTGGAFGARARFSLVVAEAAMTMVLLVGAVVMMRSLVGVWNTDPGFDKEARLTFRVTLTATPGQDLSYEFFPLMLEELRGLPAVESATISTHLPFTKWSAGRSIVVGDQSPSEPTRVGARWVADDFAETMSIRLLAGRDFTSADGASSDAVLMVNEAFVERFFPGRLPQQVIGESVGSFEYNRQTAQSDLVPHRIVGVLGNVKSEQLYETERPLTYAALWQRPAVFGRFVVRTAGAPEALAPAIRGIAASVDARQAVTEIYSMENLVAESLSEERFFAQLLAAFGLVAFGLAALGIYGSVAYSTRVRMPEIGIRLAFGAAPQAIRRLLVLEGLAPVALGIGIGCAGAAGLVRSLESLLHGVSPFDGASFAATAAAFTAVAVIAAFLPARRAAALDPLTVLRSD